MWPDTQVQLRVSEHHQAVSTLLLENPHHEVHRPFQVPGHHPPRKNKPYSNHAVFVIFVASVSVSRFWPWKLTWDFQSKSVVHCRLYDSWDWEHSSNVRQWRQRDAIGYTRARWSQYREHKSHISWKVETISVANAVGEDAEAVVRSTKPDGSSFH